MSSGNGYTVFELPDGVKAGILICYDNNIIENVRIIALMGADILLAPPQTGGCVTPSPLCMGSIDVELREKRKTKKDELENELKGHKGRLTFRVLYTGLSFPILPSSVDYRSSKPILI